MSTTISYETGSIPIDAVEAGDEVRPWLPRWWKASIAANYGVSALFSTAIVIFCLLFGEQSRHWMIFPVWVCGILAGADIIRWFRGETDVFDPKFFISVFLFIGCFIAPLIHVFYDIYGWDLYIPDWPRWLGYMAVLNIGGLVLYKLGQSLSYNKTRPVQKYWYVEPGRIFMLGLPAICLGILALAIIQIFFGGLVRVMGQTEIAAGAGAYLQFLSVLRMLGDPLVPLTMMVIICWLHFNRPERASSMLTVMTLLIPAFVLQFLAVGLRGSRIAILLGFLTVVIIIHYTLRPISKKWVMVGLVGTLIFVFLYGFRKVMGLEGWAALRSPAAAMALIADTGAGLERTVIGDLARADVQAQILQTLTRADVTQDFEYLKGRTYAMAVLTFVPRAVWPNKPRQIKGQAAGILLHGDPFWTSTRQYGLAGEAMMNFGPYAVIPAFFIFGLVVGFVRKKILTLYSGDGRLFLAPIIIILLGNMVYQDSDNIFFHMLLVGTLPFLVFFFGSSRMPVEEALGHGYGTLQAGGQLGGYTL